MDDFGDFVVVVVAGKVVVDKVVVGKVVVGKVVVDRVVVGIVADFVADRVFVDVGVDNLGSG